MTTRREFIQTTAATGLVASLPGLGSTIANATTPPASTSPLPRPRPMAANKEIRCAVIGLRGRGNNHV
ncbi:MAG: twin-arginine translocation signal domain-containing protein, partial [Planctomycetota bacterium]|nr:twin-arginine translocation signal domain-containing protein [Planctomycetota bacterium]